MKRRIFLVVQTSDELKDALQKEKRKRIRDALKQDKSIEGITVTSIVLEAIKQHLNLSGEVKADGS
jgi:hypothetical protein